jgi:hypothetical protein
VSIGYEQAREATAVTVRQFFAYAPDDADQLLAYAHGLEDVAYWLLGKSNRARHAEEERQWGKLMAL